MIQQSNHPTIKQSNERVVAELALRKLLDSLSVLRDSHVRSLAANIEWNEQSRMS